MRNKRLRSFLSNLNQTSTRFAIQELCGHSSEMSHFSGTCAEQELLLEIDWLLKMWDRS